VSDCLLQVYSIFTSFVVQLSRTVLMIAAGVGASMEIMEILLKGGAAPSVNANDMVAILCYNLAM
jgi:aspartate 1-decarboxylase